MQMKQYGDITALYGGDLEPVDIIIGGSPCQDLSIAGRRLGFDGYRSSLFLQQLRIICEMRDTYGNDKPRYMLWENVVGALSSKSGEDFRTVLELTAQIADKSAAVPRPASGKWTTAGVVMGEQYSIAWRVLDAQFWGVPQRRRRIALIADFGGQTAPEILFECKSVSRDTAESGSARHGAARCAEDCADTASHAAAICIQDNCIDRADTAGCNGKGWTKDVSYTLNTVDRHAVYAGADVYAIDRAAYNQGINALYRPANDRELAQTLTSKGPGAVYDARGNGCGGVAPTITGDHEGHISDYTAVYMDAESYVRRLTPLECERLQGYPDGWTDIGDYTDDRGHICKCSDIKRYRALGNSIALPPWLWLLTRLSSTYDHAPTMGSLFDGIGGFPLCFELINGRGSCLWSSEIDPYCSAVVKRRFNNGIYND